MIESFDSDSRLHVREIDDTIIGTKCRRAHRKRTWDGVAFSSCCEIGCRNFQPAHAIIVYRADHAAIVTEPKRSVEFVNATWHLLGHHGGRRTNIDRAKGSCLIIRPQIKHLTIRTEREEGWPDLRNIDHPLKVPGYSVEHSYAGMILIVPAGNINAIVQSSCDTEG